MQKYLKALYDILKNYHFYSIPILISEAIFQFKYNSTFNKFKYLNSNFLSDSIPCPYFFLKKIEKFIIKNNINYCCDLGSGYGKILYFLGNLNNHKIDGIELQKEIYLESLILKNTNIRIFNEDILRFNLKNIDYDLFIINDPLKKKEDLNNLILRIKKFYKKGYLIFINLDQEKFNYALGDLKLIDSFIVSKNKNIFFCRIA
tara:strand:- start:52 stop:660 length:609 start_codon:yes stop_codon:yes gene_type:complete